jgi:hypothetical protein
LHSSLVDDRPFGDDNDEDEGERNGNGNGYDEDEEEGDAYLEDLPSDTHLVIQSLQQESRGLFVPLSNGGGGAPATPPPLAPYVQVLVDYQILHRFSEQDRNVSDTVSELNSLVRTHQLCALVCRGLSCGGGSAGGGNGPLPGRHHPYFDRPHRLAYLWTCDYKTAVRAAQQQYQYEQQRQGQQGPSSASNEGSITATLCSSSSSSSSSSMNDDVTKWFLHHLSRCWGGLSTISRLDFEQEWPPGVNDHAVSAVAAAEVSMTTNSTLTLTTTTSTKTVDTAIQHLLALQVLRRDDDSNSSIAVRRNRDDERYQLWLPGWGPTLQAWEEANHHLLRRLARSPRKEVSERTLLGSGSSSSPISMPFLLQGLEQEGMIQRVQRPCGRFVKATLRPNAGSRRR